MSRADWDNARLRRLKRVAARSGLSILASTKPDLRRKGPGYMVSVDETRKVLLGDRPAPYSATLEEVEAYIENLGAEDDE